MRVGPCIEILADFAKVFAVRPEFQQLRGSGAIGRAGGVSAREDEDVLFRVDGDARNLTEVKIRRQLEKIGRRIIRDLRNLRDCRTGQRKQEAGFQCISHGHQKYHNTFWRMYDTLSRICSIYLKYCHLTLNVELFIMN